jgi:hypothetical protein
MHHQRPTVALVIAAVMAVICLSHILLPPPRAYARRYQGINRCPSAQSLIITNLVLKNGASYPYSRSRVGRDAVPGVPVWFRSLRSNEGAKKGWNPQI